MYSSSGIVGIVK